jgi:D-alanyl-D-alanine carboxypeptidase (penicillin-binding protein 5/6)
MMEEEARRIGLKKATFGNPTGLPHPKQLMTAKELAHLARFLIRTYPEYYAIFSEPLLEFNNGKKTFKFYNRNPLLNLDLGADGLKTGFVKESGYGIVASARKNDRRLIVVVAGAKTEKDRVEEAKRLFEWGFRSFKEVEIFDRAEIVGSARVWGGTRYLVPLVGEAGGVRILVPRTASQTRYKASIIYEGPLKPPIRKGDQVAILRVVGSDSGVNEVPLYAGEDVEKAGILARGFDSLILLAFGWVL